MRKHQKSDLSVKTALELYTSIPTVLGFEKVTPSVGVRGASAEKTNGEVPCTKSPISKKHLLACLQEYYKDNEEQVEQLTNHILDSRQTKVYESINHKN